MEFSSQALLIVRGEAHWSSLQAFDCQIRRENEKWVFSPWNGPVVSPEAGDLVLGINNQKRHPEKLQEWASFLLAASSIISFEKIETSVIGESLIDALWDLAKNGIPQGSLLNLVQRFSCPNQFSPDSPKAN
jgi:hypothetical protein